MTQTTKRYTTYTSAAVVVLAGVILGLLVTTSDAHAYNEKSDTVSEDYIFGWQGSEFRRITNGIIQVTHIVGMTAGSDSVLVGDDVDFEYVPPDPFFSAYDGTWDTPYGAWCYLVEEETYSGSGVWEWVMERPDICGSQVQNIHGGGGRDGMIYWAAMQPTVSMSSSDNSIVTCSGMECQAVGEGTVTLTANIPSTPAQIGAYIERDVGWSWRSEHGTAQFQQPSGYAQGDEEIDLSPTSLSWDVTVTAAPVPSVILWVNGGNTIAYNTAAPLEWDGENVDECHPTTGAGFETNGDVDGTDLSDNLTSDETFTVECTNAAGDTVNDSVLVTVGPPPASCGGATSGDYANQSALEGAGLCGTDSSLVDPPGVTDNGTGGVDNWTWTCEHDTSGDTVACAGDYDPNGDGDTTPTVDLKANGQDNISISEGQDVDLTWQVFSGDSPFDCAVSGAWTDTSNRTGAQGVVGVTESGLTEAGSPYDYTIECTDDDGDTSPPDTARVTVGPPATCDITLTADDYSVPEGEIVTLNWTVTGSGCGLIGNACVIRDGSGVDVVTNITTTGSGQTPVITSTETYTLDCGVVTDSVIIFMEPDILET